MAPAKQKRARSGDVAPGRTLHDFFSKPKNVATPSKPQRNAKQLPVASVGKGKAATNTFMDQEVIIIDSDSDDEVEFVESSSTKRRKLSPKKLEALPAPSSRRSSVKVECAEGCETFDTPHSKENSGSNLRTAREGSDRNIKPERSVSFGAPILLCSSPSISNSSPTTSSRFGKPFLLGSSPSKPNSRREASIIAPKDEVTVDLDMTIEDCDPRPTFGSPVLLVSSRKVSTSRVGMSMSVDEGVIQSGQPLAEVTPKEEVVVDFDLTLDHWDTGDDEMPTESMAANNDDDEVEILDMAADEDPISLGDEWETDMNLVDQEFFDDKPRASTSKQNADDTNSKSKCLGAGGGNAFSVLMSSFKENAAWKEATVAEDRTFRPVKANGGRRKAPFYKVLQGMPIAVDAFRYGAIPGITAYFLTHAHSDHYTNLSSSWKNGPIYCSQGTANLIIHMLSVDRKWVHPLPMDTPTEVPNTNGVTVILIEANHCPGSCLFFFEGPQSVNAGDSSYKSSYVGSSKIFRYLHCGDFRASPRHVLHPAVKGKTIDHVYLDTTYLDPKYTFPPQPLVISACAELVKRVINGQETSEKASGMLSWVAPFKNKGKDKEKDKAKPLVVVGTYSIGKERIVKAIAHALESKVYCDPRKTAILKCQADPELDALLTSNPKEATVHLVPLSTIATDRLKIYLERFPGTYNRVIGFRPTGWTFTQAAGTDQLPTIPTILSKTSQQGFAYSDLRLSGKSTPTLQLYPVPYSEHSSFYELTCFAMSFSWMKMIATVNVGSETSRGKMAKWVSRWEAERRKRGKDTVVPHRHPDYW